MVLKRRLAVCAWWNLTAHWLVALSAFFHFFLVTFALHVCFYLVYDVHNKYLYIIILVKIRTMFEGQHMERNYWEYHLLRHRHISPTNKRQHYEAALYIICKFYKDGLIHHSEILLLFKRSKSTTLCCADKLKILQYTVSQKTSQTFLIVTLRRIIRF